MERKAYGRDFGLSSRMFLTMFLLGALYVVFFVVLVQYFQLGFVPMVLLLGALAFFQYYTSDKIALAASGAKVVSPEQAPELHAMVDRLCAMADLPKPRVAIVPTDVPNAFATGRSPKHAAVAVTPGPLGPPRAARGRGRARPRALARRQPRRRRHDDRELLRDAGRLPHAHGHVDGDDGRRPEPGQNGAPAYLIMIVVSLITYVLSFILIRMISRYREYAADRGAALITGAPEYLMSALQKIASDMTRIPQRDLREVGGHERVLHHPDDRMKRSVVRAVRDAPAAREAPRPPRGHRRRDGPPRRPF